MSDTDIKNKNLVLIDYLRSFVNGYKIKAEYSTSDKDIQVIVVQEEAGVKQVFYDAHPLYNYYNIDIFGDNIQNAKDISVEIGNLIGTSTIFNWKNQKWQIIFKQFNNPRTIDWTDIRRVSYTMTLQCVVNRVA